MNEENDDKGNNDKDKMLGNVTHDLPTNELPIVESSVSLSSSSSSSSSLYRLARRWLQCQLRRKMLIRSILLCFFITWMIGSQLRDDDGDGNAKGTGNNNWTTSSSMGAASSRSNSSPDETAGCQEEQDVKEAKGKPISHGNVYSQLTVGDTVHITFSDVQDKHTGASTTIEDNEYSQNKYGGDSNNYYFDHHHDRHHFASNDNQSYNDDAKSNHNQIVIIDSPLEDPGIEVYVIGDDHGHGHCPALTGPKVEVVGAQHLSIPFGGFEYDYFYLTAGSTIKLDAHQLIGQSRVYLLKGLLPLRSTFEEDESIQDDDEEDTSRGGQSYPIGGLLDLHPIEGNIIEFLDLDQDLIPRGKFVHTIATTDYYVLMYDNYFMPSTSLSSSLAGEGFREPIDRGIDDDDDDNSYSTDRHHLNVNITIEKSTFDLTGYTPACTRQQTTVRDGCTWSGPIELSRLHRNCVIVKAVSATAQKRSDDQNDHNDTITYVNDDIPPPVSSFHIAYHQNHPVPVPSSSSIKTPSSFATTNATTLWIVALAFPPVALTLVLTGFLVCCSSDRTRNDRDMNRSILSATSSSSSTGIKSHVVATYHHQRKKERVPVKQGRAAKIEKNMIGATVANAGVLSTLVPKQHSGPVTTTMETSSKVANESTALLPK